MQCSLGYQQGHLTAPRGRLKDKCTHDDRAVHLCHPIPTQGNPEAVLHKTEGQAQASFSSYEQQYFPLGTKFSWVTLGPIYSRWLQPLSNCWCR